MRKLRLALDLDGVVYRFQHTAIYLLKAHHGVELSYDKWSTWDYLKEKISHENWKWLWTKGVTEHGLFRYGSIYKGSREFLTAITPYCDIVVITSRKGNAVLDTMDWVSYQRLPTSEVHVLGPQKKSEVKPECDAYIDDAAHNCQDLMESTSGIVIMPDRPWNQDYSPDDFTRFHRTYSWEHIQDVLKALHAQVNR